MHRKLNFNKRTSFIKNFIFSFHTKNNCSLFATTYCGKINVLFLFKLSYFCCIIIILILNALLDTNYSYRTLLYVLNEKNNCEKSEGILKGDIFFDDHKKSLDFNCISIGKNQSTVHYLG